MRRSAPLSIHIPRDAAWPWLVHALVLLVLAGLTAWLATAADPEDWTVWAGCVVAVVALMLALPVASVGLVHLRWDGAAWFLDSGDGLHMGAVPGRLRVMLDLSVAMLLRFEVDGPGRHGSRWIPVRRSKLGASWSALRRTVYSAPPWPGGQNSGEQAAYRDDPP